MSKQTKIQTRKTTAAMMNSASQTGMLVAVGDQPSPPVDTPALIREVTNSISEVIDQKLSTLSGTLEKISSSLENISKRVTEAEQRISDVEDGVTDLAGRLAEAEEKIKIMAKSLDDLENRSRRDNIRIINLKEGAEGDSPIQFFEAWLPATLGLGNSSTGKARIKIDRAHRGLGLRGAHPRPVIIKLHNSRDKQRIMAAVRAAPELHYDGQRIFIHQDFSYAIREKRRGFNASCRALIDKGIHFRMRYPATLVLNHNGTEHKFDSPKDAQSFINALD
ncbi:unnamed protein product [Oreochromis niloticus]|nr:unnamed protein product [Mustela putorius furo]